MRAVRGAGVNRVEADFSGVRPSAVLVLIADDADGNAGVLLTRRSTSLRNHSGSDQLSRWPYRPGRDGDRRRRCVRPTKRSGSIPPPSRSSGSSTTLRPIVSRSHIVPVVARADVTARPCAGLARGRARLVGAARRVRARRHVPGGTVERARGAAEERVLYFFELDDETVWGATAHVLVDLFNRLR